MEAAPRQQDKSGTTSDVIDRALGGEAKQDRLFARTKKAEFYVLPDDSLVKRYVTHEARQMVERDAASLQTIRRRMGYADFEGWVYRIVELQWVDVERGMVAQEIASGSTLPNLPAKLAAEAEYHCGVWLASYHNRVFGSDREGFVYTDFTVHNILIDFDKQTVVAIDPGIFWGTRGYLFEDVQRHISSTINSHLLRWQLPFAAVARFLQGYGRATDRTPRLRDCYLGLARELCRQVRDFARLSWVKLGLYLVLLVFALPFYLTLIPFSFWWLSRRGRSTRWSDDVSVSDSERA